MSKIATKINQGLDSEEHHSKAQVWLDASGARVGAHRGALLVRRGDKVTVVGSFPNRNSVEKDFEQLASRAFQEHRVIQRIGQPIADSQQHRLAWVAFSLRISRRPAVVAFELNVSDAKSDDTLFEEIGSLILRRDDDAAAMADTRGLVNHHSQKIEHSSNTVQQINEDTTSTIGLKPKIDENLRRGSDKLVDNLQDNEANKLLEEQSSVINTLASLLDQKEFEKSLHAFANGIAKHWGCLRVTIGLARSRHVEIKAISGVVDFDRRSALMVDIAQALEETITSASMIVLPTDDDISAPPQGHISLASQLKNPALCSFPLLDGKQIVGAVLLERDHKFTKQEKQQLTRMALLLAPIIALKRLEAMGSLQWLGRFAKLNLQSLLGSTKLGLKVFLISLAGFLIWSSIYTKMFTIDAQAAIEARVQRAVVAYAQSYLSQVEKKAGDIVKQGDILAQLDVEDLQLDRIKWVGERDKLTKEYRANLAQRDRSNIRILEARRSQAQSQIDLLDAKIERATLRAPVDGVVVSGDLSQVVGSPVEQGQLLFEVASLEEFRLSLMVDEADIGWVQIGKEGYLRLRSLPDQSFQFSITAITPVSESGEGANLFRVEASLAELPASLRPGMRGFAKIEVEPRAIGWIWSRSFMNWLRIQSWKYGL